MAKYVIICFISAFLQLHGFSQQVSKTKSIEELHIALADKNTPTDHADLLLDLALAYVLKPGSFSHDLDTAILLINQADIINNKNLHSKTIEAKACYVYSNAYREKGDTATGHRYINKALNHYSALNMSEELGKSYFEKASYFNWQDSKYYPVIKDYFEKALTQFKLSDDKQNQGFALKNMADFDVLMKNYGLALNELNEALSIYKSINYEKLQSVYDLLNLVHINLGDYPQAIQYGLLAEDAAVKTHDTTMQLCTIYFRLSLAYSKGYNSTGDESIKYERKALNIALKQQDFQSIQLIAASLCYLYTRRHQPQKAIRLIHDLGDNIKFNDWADSLYVFSAYLQVFTEAKQYSKAKFYTDYLVSVLSDTSKDLSTDQPNIAFEGLVRYYIETHQYDLAEKYASINLVYCRHQHNSNRAIIATAYNTKSAADSAIGDFRSSLYNYKQFVRINDSMFNEAKAFQFAQMQVVYNTRQKEDSLKINKQNFQLLKTKNETDLRKAGIVRNTIILSSFLLLLIMYISYHVKQNSNKKLQAKQKEINHQNEELTRTVQEKNTLLEEKEWLLKEVHHRVKNNLQIVISLLNTQSRFLDNKEAINAIAESRHRMQAMSLIHQKLYQSEQTAYVDMQSYIRELAGYLETSYNMDKHICFVFKIDKIELDIAQAIPVSLILNETITNAIKYAFAGREDGKIEITMQAHEDDEILLSIQDDGKGLPSSFNIDTNDSMGMRLIKGLVKQISARLDISGEDGTCIIIRFATDSKLKIIALNEAGRKEQAVAM